MPQINDCIMAQLGPGQINDLLLTYYKANGATSDELNDAEYEFLVAGGATPAHVDDMWMEYLGGLGHTGALNDRKASFWCV